MTRPLLWIITITLFCIGCIDDPLDEVVEVLGHKPIYVEVEIGDQVSAAAEPYAELDNFQKSNDMLFIVSRGKGVHVIDNSDPTAPINLAFLAIPGIIDLVIRDRIAIATTSFRLIAVDFSDLTNAYVSSITRLENVGGIGLLAPTTLPDFECVDADQGVLAGWEEQMLTNPKCHY